MFEPNRKLMNVYLSLVETIRTTDRIIPPNYGLNPVSSTRTGSRQFRAEQNVRTFLFEQPADESLTPVLKESVARLRHLRLADFLDQYGIFHRDSDLNGQLEWLSCYFVVSEWYRHIPVINACQPPGEPIWLTVLSTFDIYTGLRALYDQAVSHAGDKLQIPYNPWVHGDTLNIQTHDFIAVLRRSYLWRTQSTSTQNEKEIYEKIQTQ